MLFFSPLLLFICFADFVVYTKHNVIKLQALTQTHFTIWKLEDVIKLTHINERTDLL